MSQADLREFDYEVSRGDHSVNRESKVENTIEVRACAQSLLMSRSLRHLPF